MFYMERGKIMKKNKKIVLCWVIVILVAVLVVGCRIAFQFMLIDWVINY